MKRPKSCRMATSSSGAFRPPNRNRNLRQSPNRGRKLRPNPVRTACVSELLRRRLYPPIVLAYQTRFPNIGAQRHNRRTGMP